MSAEAAICPVCSVRLAPMAQRCRCGAPASETSSLPPIYVTRRDFGRLEALARVPLQSTKEEVARFLAAELDRAVVCHSDDMLDDVVTMRSRVIFRADEDREIESCVLVYPEDYDPSGAVISILSPLGVALLGLREGGTMPYTTLQGTARRAVVEKVAYRPDRPADAASTHSTL